MRITHLRQADLNLLVVFTALAEERNVTCAASRLLLSQPSVSRALQRLREMFQDDLLIRSPSGYEPTPKGKRLLQELSTMMPRLDHLLSGEDFDPQAEETTFRGQQPIMLPRALPFDLQQGSARGGESLD